jgi:hypothetical protein
MDIKYLHLWANLQQRLDHIQQLNKPINPSYRYKSYFSIPWNGSSGPDYYNAPRILLVSLYQTFLTVWQYLAISVPKNVTSIEDNQSTFNSSCVQTCDNTAQQQVTLLQITMCTLLQTGF